MNKKNGLQVNSNYSSLNFILIPVRRIITFISTRAWRGGGRGHAPHIYFQGVAPSPPNSIFEAEEHQIIGFLLEFKIFYRITKFILMLRAMFTPTPLVPTQRCNR